MNYPRLFSPITIKPGFTLNANLDAALRRWRFVESLSTS